MREPPPGATPPQPGTLKKCRTPSPIGVRARPPVPLAQCAAAGARRHLAARPGPLTAALRPCRGPGRGGPPALRLRRTAGGRIIRLEFWPHMHGSPGWDPGPGSACQIHMNAHAYGSCKIAEGARQTVRRPTASAPLRVVPSRSPEVGGPTSHPSPARPPTPDVNVDQHRSPHGMHAAPTRTRCP